MDKDTALLKKIFPYEKYKELAGADWPSYEDIINQKPIKNSLINIEIQNYIIKAIESHEKYNPTKHEREFTPLEFYVKMVLPGIIGTCIYFWLGGSWLKLILIFFGFYIINFLHNFSVHRWLSHGQVDPKIWVKHILLWVTTTVGVCPNSSWVRLHRCHHQFGETQWDPYPAVFGPARLLMNRHYGIHPKWDNFKYFNDRAIDFVEDHYFKLYFLNLLIFAFIDIDIVLLSFAFLRLYTFLVHGYSSWRFHQAKLDGVPDNIPVRFEFLFGGDALHKEHHDSPKKFNCSIPGRIDPAYYIMRWIAK